MMHQAFACLTKHELFVVGDICNNDVQRGALSLLTRDDGCSLQVSVGLHMVVCGHTLLCIGGCINVHVR
jgi:hypothetical protein